MYPFNVESIVSDDSKLNPYTLTNKLPSSFMNKVDFSYVEFCTKLQPFNCCGIYPSTVAESTTLDIAIPPDI
jgi:hypothetical protein